MDILSNYWSPALKLPVVLLCVRVLLGAPNFRDPCFASAFKLDGLQSCLQDAITVHRVCRSWGDKLGLFYIWIGSQAAFRDLPRAIWYEAVLPHLVLESARVSMSELAAAAGVPPEMLAAACTAEQLAWRAQ